MFFAAGTAFRMASSISPVSLTSNSVSTRSVSPLSSTRPAFDQPQLPSGISQAWWPLPRSCRPLVYFQFFISIQLDVRVADHLAPLLVVLVHDGGEFGRCG